jgi:hypothetical protein
MFFDFYVKRNTIKKTLASQIFLCLFYVSMSYMLQNQFIIYDSFTIPNKKCFYFFDLNALLIKQINALISTRLTLYKNKLLKIQL